MSTSGEDKDIMIALLLNLYIKFLWNIGLSIKVNGNNYYF